jgi:DNA-binding transcriptional LysR family regulator
MEINELRYFACAARHQNLQKAALELNISPGSVSKAIAKLEEHLGVLLFERVGRSVVLSDHGKILQIRAAKILQLVDGSKLEITGQPERLQVTVTGLEVFLASFARKLLQSIYVKNPKIVMRFESESTEEKCIQKVQRGEAHLAITTLDVPNGMHSQVLAQTHFQTCAGPGHPLYRHSNETEIQVSEILKHAFVCPESGMLGRTQEKMSADGWRDDKFPRQIHFIANDLKVLESIVASGYALAYLPDFVVENLKLKALKVAGCPYTCKQKIRLVGSAELMPYALRSLF